jgi:hypothetical protein
MWQREDDRAQPWEPTQIPSFFRASGLRPGWTARLLRRPVPLEGAVPLEGGLTRLLYYQLVGGAGIILQGD